MQHVSMSTYLISNQTMAIISINQEHYHSLILEPDKKIVTVKKPIQILHESCIVAGSTFNGRRLAIKEMLGTDKKLPVPVDSERGIYIIATSAVKNEECAWVSYSHIQKFQDKDYQTLITFRNGYELLVDTSRKSFEQLYYRTSNIVVQLNHNKLFGQEDYPPMCPLLKFHKRFT